MFRFINRPSIRGRLYLVILISAASYVFMMLHSLARDRANWRERIEEKGVKVNQFLANISATPIQTSDYISIVDYIEDLKEDDEIAYVIVYKGEDTVITREEKRIKASLPDLGQIKTVCADVIFYGERIGWIETGISLEKMNQAVRASLIRAGSILAVQSVLVVILVLLAKGIINRDYSPFRYE